MTFWKRKQVWRCEKKLVVEHREFLGQLTILYDSVMVSTCCYAFVKTLRMYNMENDPNVIYGI